MEKILYREGFTAEELPKEVIERIKGVSYKENPRVKLGDLVYLRVRYYDFEHKVQSGSLSWRGSLRRRFWIFSMSFSRQRQL